ncbi:HD-GYP domain-containing protein [Bacillus sp. EB600]|uniref:HD-GYP domain-containing protein n=1 Tax=Bacillus sp. EB600 TaxID=2806345 RepID=UPI00210862FA|nr:HD domain-containing phosphohydrolase [Bacillus sp. EB600]MCQ6280849.1 HD domain-containing protein [Bacillus sp. EB600]
MKVNERSLIEGLSYALDVAEKSYFSHAKHVAYTSFMIAKELNLPKEQQTDIYYAALLHDIGASNSCSIEDHCIVGRDIINNLPVKNSISEYVFYHHEHVNGTGPFHLKGEEIPFPAQIICFADFFDTGFSGPKNINYASFKEITGWLNEIKALFDPEIFTAFRKLIEKEYFLLDYFNYEFNNILSRRIEVQENELNWEGIKGFAQAFSKIIDMRSPFTHRHSIGIAELVNKITKELGYDYEIQNKMYVAALLHDVGKLAVSNDILDKEGKLTEKERYEINKHAYYTRWILEQIEGFEEITEFASNHHEKLNGNGYPLHLYEDQVGELDRIMTICDIYQALTEERPYRKQMPIAKVWALIDEMVEQNQLDGVLVGRIKTILP